jgi:hypothetical protein
MIDNTCMSDACMHEPYMPTRHAAMPCSVHVYQQVQLVHRGSRQVSLVPYYINIAAKYIQPLLKKVLLNGHVTMHDADRAPSRHSTHSFSPDTLSWVSGVILHTSSSSSLFQIHTQGQLVMNNVAQTPGVVRLLKISTTGSCQ